MEGWREGKDDAHGTAMRTGSLPATEAEAVGAKNYAKETSSPSPHPALQEPCLLAKYLKGCAHCVPVFLKDPLKRGSPRKARFLLISWLAPRPQAALLRSGSSTLFKSGTGAPLENSVPLVPAASHGSHRAHPSETLRSGHNMAPLFKCIFKFFFGGGEVTYS